MLILIIFAICFFQTHRVTRFFLVFHWYYYVQVAAGYFLLLEQRHGKITVGIFFVPRNVPPNALLFPLAFLPVLYYAFTITGIFSNLFCQKQVKNHFFDSGR